MFNLFNGLRVGKSEVGEGSSDRNTSMVFWGNARSCQTVMLLFPSMSVVGGLGWAGQHN